MRPRSDSRGVTYSIASCLVETGRRLAATPDFEDRSNSALRRAGRALLAAEVLAFRNIDDRTKRRRGGQGLVIELGFYNSIDLDVIESNLDEVEEAVGLSVGGWPWGIQLSLQILKDDLNWLGTTYEWPDEELYAHLDHFEGPITRTNPINDLGILQILGRRLRFRRGIDHAGGIKNFFWWTTPQTEEWIARALSNNEENQLDLQMRKDFNYSVSNLAYEVYRIKSSYDPLYNSPDDWGSVDLTRDPIALTTIGPFSNRAQTHDDVQYTLERAGDQLQVTYSKVSRPEIKDHDPGIPYAEALEELASSELERRELDVVLLYRGGFSHHNMIKKSSTDRILAAAEDLVDQGIEVVIAMGHGSTSIHSISGAYPIVGVYEAMTPTAGANWILQEHVNQRLMNYWPDPGQPLL